MGASTIVVLIILLPFHLLAFGVVFGDFIRMIRCKKKVDAIVKSVTEEQDKYEDSSTGKAKYKHQKCLHQY